MALDNPSYFSLSSDQTSEGRKSGGSTGVGLTAFFRRRATPVKTHTSSAIGNMDRNAARRARYGASSNNAEEDPEECAPMLSRNNDNARYSPSSNGASGSTINQRRSFRNLFRSVSANCDERTKQFLRGDPRPSDIAPPSPYLPHRSHSHTENDRRRPRCGRRTLKSASELLSNDMVFCGLPAGEDTVDHKRISDDEDEDRDSAGEVFLGVDDARYYNLSATLPSGSRRHSISTFFDKDRRGAASGNHARAMPVCNEVLVEPTTMAPAIPTELRSENSSSKKHRKCKSSPSSKGSRSATVLSNGNFDDDVIFVSCKESEASGLWVNYLTACFEQISRQQGRPPFKVRHVTVEESQTDSQLSGIERARLQIIVVCPVLLERVTSRAEQVSSLSKHLIPDRVLAMLLGVQDSHVTESHRATLITYNRWRKYFVKDQDETFVGEFLSAAIGILGPATTQQVATADKCGFSVHPKKVKLGHNRVIVLLNEPLRPDDSVVVYVDRCGEAIEISNVKKRNPYTLQFAIPERCLEMSMLVGVRVTKNGRPLGARQVKCESRLRELDQILRAHDNPLEFMCQTFGFHSGDREQLDNWMVHAFQKNVPPNFNLLSSPNGYVQHKKNYSSTDENPTLLHFAARFGLERLAWQLLECPGSEIACEMRNAVELTPAELAEQAGHIKLAHQLRSYMQMNEFTNMYSYLKVISENSSDSLAGKNNESKIKDDDKDNYCRPRSLSEAYSVPPAARPVTSLILPQQVPSIGNSTVNTSDTSADLNYAIVPPPTPVLTSPAATPTPASATSIDNGLDSMHQGYLKMYPIGPKPAQSTTSLQSSQSETPSRINRQESTSSSNAGSRDDENCQATGGSRTGTSSIKSRESSGPQDELLEIINDFKNNVFTISEVERLVDAWRNRNDVQQSFKDKQRQLTAMREEYERIQKKIKDDMKAPSPFDRIRKFFTKGKRDTKDSADTNEENLQKGEYANNTLTDRRPISSLSLRSTSSSSSSGRMSTVSGCSGTSLGDSGTHSDPDEKRYQNLKTEKTGMTSYEIPPAPKPFIGGNSFGSRYTPFPRCLTNTNDLDTKTSQSPQKSDDNQYYIAFPPSGLPVHSFKTENREPKTPCSPTDQFKLIDRHENGTFSRHNSIERGNFHHNSYANINPSKLAKPPKLTPCSPPTLAAPPGMCLIANYMNVTPRVEQPQLVQEFAQVHRVDSEDSHKVPLPPKELADNSFRHQQTYETTFRSKENKSFDILPDNDNKEYSKTNQLIEKQPKGDKEIALKTNEEENKKISENCDNYKIINSNEIETKVSQKNYILTGELQNQSNSAFNSEEYIETDIIADQADCDVTDSVQLPNYSNIEIHSIDTKSTAIKKKLPAPPVPPRNMQKK